MGSGSSYDVAILHWTLVSNLSVIGNEDVGGLAGAAQNLYILSSSSLLNNVTASSSNAGGLVGWIRGGAIISDYVEGFRVRSGVGHSGGLVGYSKAISITASYARDGYSYAPSGSGGMGGSMEFSSVYYSYVADVEVEGDSSTGGLVGATNVDRANAWDSVYQNIYSSEAWSYQADLRQPTSASGIYANWFNRNNLTGGHLDLSFSYSCDLNRNLVVDPFEIRDDNRLWDFGTSSEYPVLPCVSRGVEGQR